MPLRYSDIVKFHSRHSFLLFLHSYKSLESFLKFFHQHSRWLTHTHSLLSAWVKVKSCEDNNRFKCRFSVSKEGGMEEGWTAILQTTPIWMLGDEKKETAGRIRMIILIFFTWSWTWVKWFWGNRWFSKPTSLHEPRTSDEVILSGLLCWSPEKKNSLFLFLSLSSLHLLMHKNF